MKGSAGQRLHQGLGRVVPTCDNLCLGALLTEGGVPKVAEVLEAALDIQVGH